MPPRHYIPAVILAADQWVLAHGVSDDGCTRLMGGLFGLVRKDLERGCQATRHWLDSAEFAILCDACRVDPPALRDHLVTAHWHGHAREGATPDDRHRPASCLA